MKDIYRKLEIKRDKLTSLVNQAIEEKQPIGTNNSILTQSRKLDLLIEKLLNQIKISEPDKSQICLYVIEYRHLCANYHEFASLMLV